MIIGFSEIYYKTQRVCIHVYKKVPYNVIVDITRKEPLLC